MTLSNTDSLVLLPTPPDSRPRSPHTKDDASNKLQRVTPVIPLSFLSNEQLASTVVGPPTPDEPIETPTQSRFKVANGLLQVSPYTSIDHCLDLSSVSRPNQLLAQALTTFEATRGDYATAPYAESFNWDVVVEKLRDLLAANPDFHWEEESFYIVVFRSQIPTTTDRSHLGALDEVAHQEATASGGLLKYWFGLPDADGRNLATCVWRNHADAKAGGTGPGHREAGRQARLLYTEWVIERKRFIISEGGREWKVIPWAD